MKTFDPEAAEKPAASSFESEIGETAGWFASPRFEGVTRLYSARQVVEQRGTIPTDYTVARMAAEQFHERLRQLFGGRQQITTFGPYSPGQAVALKRMGIEGIYLGGWATSARGSVTEDPGPDLASYPLYPGARRGRADSARPAHGGPEPAVRPVPHERGATCCLRPRSITGRSSLPTPTPDMAAMRTSGT